MFTYIIRKQFKYCQNMSKRDIVEVKKKKVTIQFQLTEEEYTEIQRFKLNEGKSRGRNSDFYKELLFRGLQNKPI